VGCYAVTDEKEGEKKRGPKGGIKHTPGRGHAAKSGPSRKKRISKRLKKKHQKRKEAAEKQREAYERLSDEQKKLLTPEDMKIDEDEK
jgi:hypothetical protein